MGNIFSPAEVVEMGIKIEENGKSFYDTVAKKSKNKNAQKVFELLATEEGNHIKRFEVILSQVKKYEPPEAYTEDYFSYIKSLSSEYVFTNKDKGEETARSAKTDKEALELGIGFEKQSILFYEEMKKFVLEGEQKIVSKLLEEEKEHLRKLNDLVGQV